MNVVRLNEDRITIDIPGDNLWIVNNKEATQLRDSLNEVLGASPKGELESLGAALGRTLDKLNVNKPTLESPGYVLLAEWMLGEGLVKQEGDMMTSAKNDWLRWWPVELGQDFTFWGTKYRRPIALWNASTIGKKYPL